MLVICRKNEISDILESAGFSKANPYYVVQQGKASLQSEPASLLLNLVTSFALYNHFQQGQKIAKHISKLNEYRTEQESYGFWNGLLKHLKIMLNTWEIRPLVLVLLPLKSSIIFRCALQSSVHAFHITACTTALSLSVPWDSLNRVSNLQITALSTMEDGERLSLLKEIGGSKVYEDRRTESLKILQDAEGRKRQIAELVCQFHSTSTCSSIPSRLIKPGYNLFMLGSFRSFRFAYSISGTIGYILGALFCSIKV